MNCDERNKYISIVLSLPTHIQLELKAVIEKVSNGTLFEQLAKSPSGEVVNTEKPLSVNRCETCFELRDLNGNLSNEIKDLLAERKEFVRNIKAELSKNMDKLVDTEIALGNKDEDLKTMSESLEAALAKAVRYETLLRDMEKSKDECIHQLVGEVETLRHECSRGDRLESKIEKLRARLEGLVDVEQRLTLEISEHAETRSQLVIAQREVLHLSKLKTQVKEYRAQYAASCISLEELTEAVKRKEARCVELEAANIVLRDIRQAQAEQNAFLHEELVATNETLEENTSHTAKHGVVDELDPAVRSELEGLRAENKDLTARVLLCSPETADQLQRSLDDQLCTNTLLQQKWLDSKAELEAACAELAALRLSLEVLEAVRGNLLAHIDELTETHLEETRGCMLKWESEKERLENVNRDAERRVCEVQAALAESMEEIAVILQSKALADSGLAALLAEKNELEEELSALQAKHQQEKEAGERAAEARICAVRAELESSLVAERELGKKRQGDLTADIEEERVKRRRLEREKKNADAELHRYKSQAQTSGGGGAEEVEAALKEMREMQTELDAANTELQTLRSKTGADQSKSSKEVVGVATRRTRYAAASSAESSDLTDKRVEQLTREKRELIAKNLEENKEKMDLAQKLLGSEKEITALKQKLTKLALDKERLERKQQSGGSGIAARVHDENAAVDWEKL